MFKTITTLLLLIGLIACKKDGKIEKPITNQPAASNQGSIVVNITAKANSKNLIKETVFDKSTGTDSFKVSILKYYLSNLYLTTNENTEIKINEYILTEHFGSTVSFTLNNINEGNYKKFRMLLGVDPERNTSGAQSGSLDPLNGMFWDWNTGYIFFKLEGDYKTLGSNALKPIAMHIGGFEGKNNSLKEFTFNDLDLKIKANRKTSINMELNLDEIFINPQQLDLANISIAVTASEAKIIADNYADMFSIKSIQNP
jgi:hypothetical protein